MLSHHIVAFSFSGLDCFTTDPYWASMPVGSLRIPKFISPQFPLLSAKPPEGEGWIHEIKHDGYRTLIVIDRGRSANNDFSAVISINDRPPCISYTGAALLGSGPRPWEISHLPGHFKTGRLSRCYTAAPPPTRTDRDALSSHPNARLSPQEGSLLIGGRDRARRRRSLRSRTM